jgi:hypothetical protein
VVELEIAVETEIVIAVIARETGTEEGMANAEDAAAVIGITKDVTDDRDHWI